MKYLIFNIAVVAAIGYILYERGDLDGTVLKDLAERAETVVTEASAAKPTAGIPQQGPLAEGRAESAVVDAPAELSHRLSSQAATKPAQEPMSQPSPDPARPATAGPSQVLGDEPLAAEAEAASIRDVADPVIDPEEEAAPAAIAEPVAPDVAARRAVVLDTATRDGSEPDRPVMTASERQDNLRSLAEDMEFLSIEMIYR